MQEPTLIAGQFQPNGCRFGPAPAPNRQPRPDWLARETLRLVSRRRNVSLSQLLRPSRGTATVAEARQMAMYLMHVVLRRNYAEVGAVFGRDRTTVAHACARIEDRRDLPHLDQELANLEQLLTQRLQRRFSIHAAA